MTDAEIAADLRDWYAAYSDCHDSATFLEAADRIQALAAERDSAVARAAELEEACRRAMRYCAGVNLAGPQAARCELSDALLAGTGGGR